MLNHFRYAVLMAIAIASCGTQDERSNADTASAVEVLRGDDRLSMRASWSEHTLRETSLGYETTIPYTYTNRTIDTVFVVNCNGDVSPGLQRKVGADAWETWWMPGTNSCLSAPLKIGRGASYSDSLRVVITSQPHDSVYYNQLRTASPADTFRLIWHHALVSFDVTMRPFGDRLPTEDRVSNAFTLTTVRR